ncbi:hypothetical protein DH2020_044052 [Rehmannia glutinosa]|uniref:Uncharacterized protein n=1 Tax=Rehmannia glutinosa TaxID=99300 RepID=A0ABR0UIW1_REHGL
MLYKRFLCTQTAVRHRHSNQWPVKQVEKSNFSEALAEIKAYIANSDFVAVSLQKTGGHSAPWQKILPIDTAETAYIKAKHAAMRFQILQFSVCPFSVKASKLIAHPAQESAAKFQIGHLSPSSSTVGSLSAHSVADSLFSERIKSRVKSWINARKVSNKTEDALISTLRRLVSGSEVYGSRPSLTIDVCSERQVQLALEALKEFIDIVPLQVPVKGGGVQGVRVVLTSSEEDKNLLEKEIQDKEQEQRKVVRGFREVIDLISASQKPVVAHNSLNDFAFIHSKFLAPLPLTMDEFRSTLLSVFPHILDVNHLMKEIGAFEKMSNMPAAISYLDKRSFAPINMEISNRETDKVNIHGHNVLKVCQLFVKLCSTLKISLEVLEGDYNQLSPSLQCHSNTFNPCSTNSRESDADDVRIWTGNTRTVSIENLVFLWGFKSGISARNLKDLLCDSHDVFSEEFDVRMIDRTCAIVVLWTPGFSERFLRIMDSGDILSDLGESLDQAMDETEILLEAKSPQEQSVYELMDFLEAMAYLSASILAQTVQHEDTL